MRARQEANSSYRALLSDPRWQKKRLEILQRDGWKCRICEATHRQLQIHHLRYFPKRIAPWEYPDHLLITLCEPCHEHQTLKQRKKRKKIFRAFWRRVRS